MEEMIASKEKTLTQVTMLLQNILYLFVVIYYWGDANAWWLSIIFVLLMGFNVLAMKYLQSKRYILLTAIIQLVAAFLIIYFSGNTESPFFPVYYLPVITSVALITKPEQPKDIFITTILASILSFISTLLMNQTIFLDWMRVGVYSVSYVALGYGVMFYQYRLEQSIKNAKIDFLTESFNRKTGEALLVEGIDHAREKGTPVSIAFCDLDKFKVLNDTYGHLCGDMILKQVAAMFNENIPEDSQVVRWGGEEFMLIFPNKTEVEAVQIMENIRKKIESHSFYYMDQKLSVTISGGVVEVDRGSDDMLDAISKADRCLYEAKAFGRNKILAGGCNLGSDPKLRPTK
ncbi:diguanylate cyclase [Ornithinibacillus sp. L9]|uniref:Diguanylate cyclase n=1 Tax=Ornithinibacillus caprae TaxID=2678566 RepID=A0A6N8FCZ8_9BACI|nr:GGDEF domain-containing protein [Ornithinibacillus caprae]MUK87542.1 diguanylate cyclase [Ornithinibacillus caprae]